MTISVQELLKSNLPQGFTGSRGETGFTGSIGFTGSQGETGFTGSVGFTGSQGETGFTGSVGFTGSQGIQGVGGEWVLVNSNYTASSADMLICDSSGGTFTITMPFEPAAGDYVKLADANSWKDINVTVDGNEETFEGTAAQLILNVEEVLVTLIYDGSTWQVFTNVGPVGQSWDVGDIRYTSQTLNAPEWLKADASIYLQNTYPQLFESLGLLRNNFQYDGVFSDAEILEDYTDIYQILYEDNILIAAGDSGKLSTSTDGITWTFRNSQLTDEISLLFYANSLFFAISGRALSTSTDGITWTLRTTNFTEFSEITSITYGNGLYIIAGSEGQLATSTNGESWTLRTSEFDSSRINGLAFGNDIFVAVGEEGKIATSADGESWSLISSSILIELQQITFITFGANTFIFGRDGTLLQSEDFTSIEVVNENFVGFISLPTNSFALKYTNDMFVFIGRVDRGTLTIVTSKDGIVWEQNYFVNTSNPRSFTYFNQSFLITTSNPYLLSISEPYDLDTQFTTPKMPKINGSTAYIKT
jgi:hypothetical protein